jgi:HD domain
MSVRRLVGCRGGGVVARYGGVVDTTVSTPHAAEPAPSERALQWVATMEGSPVGTARLAHPDATTGVAGGVVLDRADREAAEDRTLAIGATRAAGAGRRALPEQPDEWRTCFERDRDRILHSNAFRRLAGKTQVFVHPADHQRTRLTHAIEVAQVASAIARALRLNVALTEAIAYGHDCGHGPGGHASEDALSPYVAEGYDHAVWGADVVLPGLNLCAETLDGIRCHSWSRPAPATPEGEVVSWADRIAYVCHDFEDAVAAGIVTVEMLPALVRSRIGTDRSAQLGTLVCCRRWSPAVAGRPAASSSAPSCAPWSRQRHRPVGSAWTARPPRRWRRCGPPTTATSTCGRPPSPRRPRSPRSCGPSSSISPTTRGASPPPGGTRARPAAPRRSGRRSLTSAG